MSNIRSRKALAVCAGLASLIALAVAGQSRAPSRGRKALIFEMPACPIEAKTVDPTKTPFQVPRGNPLVEPLSITGTIQVTDQTSSTVILVQNDLAADKTGVSYSRTVKTLQHATGTVTFDKGCTKTDQYGSNDCQWAWGEAVTVAHEGALQEDLTAGKLIVDLKINGNPLQFTCSVCGAPCIVPVPEGLDHGSANMIWDMAIALFGHHHPHDRDANQP